MGMFTSIGRSLKKTASSIAKGVSQLFDKKNVSQRVGAVASAFADVAGVEANPKLGGPRFTESPYFFSKKEWKKRKRLRTISSLSRRRNRNK